MIGFTCSCSICNGTFDPYPEFNDDDFLEWAYQDYVSKCEEKKVKPLDFDEWFDTLTIQPK